MRVHAHLLDVSRSVDHVDQEVADRPVVGADRHQRPAAVGIRREILDRTRVVVGDELHPERPERLARGPLDLDQRGEFSRRAGRILTP